MSSGLGSLRVPFCFVFLFISFILRQASPSGGPCLHSTDLEISAERKHLFPHNSSRRPAVALHCADFGHMFFSQQITVVRGTHGMDWPALTMSSPTEPGGWSRSHQNHELRGRGWFLKGKMGFYNLIRVNVLGQAPRTSCLLTSVCFFNLISISYRSKFDYFKSLEYLKQIKFRNYWLCFVLVFFFWSFCFFSYPSWHKVTEDFI